MTEGVQGHMDETEVLERLLLDLYSHTDTSEENLHGDHDRLSAENLSKNIFSLVASVSDSGPATSVRAKQLQLLLISENPPSLLNFIARLDEVKAVGLADDKDLLKAKVKKYLLRI